MRSSCFGKTERAFVARIRGKPSKASLDWTKDSFNVSDIVEKLEDG